MKTKKEKIYTVIATETNHLMATRIQAKDKAEAREQFQYLWDNGKISIASSDLDVDITEDK